MLAGGFEAPEGMFAAEDDRLKGDNAAVQPGFVAPGEAGDDGRVEVGGQFLLHGPGGGVDPE